MIKVSDREKKRQRKMREGLTLIEVLLAIAILGIGIAGLVASASRCIAVVRQAKNYETARRLLGEIELTEPLFADEIEEGTESGSFPVPYDNYQWIRTVALEGEEEDGLYKLSMRVNWSDKGTENHEEVVTYLYAPEEASGGSFSR